MRRLLVATRCACHSNPTLEKLIISIGANLLSGSEYIGKVSLEDAERSFAIFRRPLKRVPDEQPMHAIECAERSSKATRCDRALVHKGGCHDGYDHHRRC